jgi:hypothetical protein
VVPAGRRDGKIRGVSEGVWGRFELQEKVKEREGEPQITSFLGDF